MRFAEHGLCQVEEADFSRYSLEVRSCGQIWVRLVRAQFQSSHLDDFRHSMALESHTLHFLVHGSKATIWHTWDLCVWNLTQQFLPTQFGSLTNLSDTLLLGHGHGPESLSPLPGWHHHDEGRVGWQVVTAPTAFQMSSDWCHPLMAGILYSSLPVHAWVDPENLYHSALTARRATTKIDSSVCVSKCRIA